MTRTVTVVLASALALAGCSLFPSSPPVVDIAGTVVNASRDEPLAGLSLTLRTGGWAGGAVAAQTRTDAQGRFHLRVEGADYLQFEVNDEPYDMRYQGPGVESIHDGDLQDVREVRVYENVRLTVTAETDRPLGPDDSYMIWLPCSGGRSPTSTFCARGNAYNDVRLVVNRSGEAQLDTTVQVYTPVGEETVFAMTY